MSLYFLHETCYWLWIIITLHIIIHAYAFFMNKRRIAVEKFWKRKKKVFVGHGTRTINVFELYLLEGFKIIPEENFQCLASDGNNVLFCWKIAILKLMKLICECLCIFAILNNPVNNKSFFEMEKKDCFNFGAIFPDQSFFSPSINIFIFSSLKVKTHIYCYC